MVECCVECDVWTGCAGVAYRDGECITLNVGAQESLIPGDETSEAFKVLLHDAQVDQQVGGKCKNTVESTILYF